VLVAAVNALGIYIAYPPGEWSGYLSFPRWWSAIQPLLSLPVNLFLICAPALLSLLSLARVRSPGFA
jgi:hypothetical protein